MIFFSFFVDLINGIDSDTNDVNKTYKTLEHALSLLNSGDNVFIYPGKYSGINLESETNMFEYGIKGFGHVVEFGEIKHTGFIKSLIENIKIRDVICESSSSIFTYKNIEFIGGHTFLCKGFNKSLEIPTNEIEFIDCTFGINFQLIVKSGIYNISFKNCTFRSKILPLICLKGGTVDLKLTLCNLDVPIVNNIICN